jgi:dTDP-4-dehydrorhamnose reductase
MSSANMRVWIAGAGGTLGKVLVKRFDHTTDYKLLISDKDIALDNLQDVNRFADMSHPDVIIDCASMNNIKKCEENPEEAYKVNAIGARNLAVAAKRVNARLIYISSDQVFDGVDETPLNEFETPVPKSVYGKSKLAGEHFVETLTDKHVIIRTSWLYGHGTRNFVDKVLEDAKAGEEIVLPDCGFSSPTSCHALADFVSYMIEAKSYGIYHASCEGYCTREEFAREALKIAGIEDYKLRVETEHPGSVYTPLDNMMLHITKEFEMPEWKEDLKKYILG